MDTLAESLLLLTKVNSKVVDKIKELDNKIDSIVIASTKTVTPQTVNTKQKTTQPTTIVKADAVDKTIVKTVEKPKTVIISDFTKEALNDLAGVLGSKQVQEVADGGDKPEKSKSGMKVLGWLAAAAATYAIIKNFKLENIPGLIKGLQGAGKQITKLKGRISKSFTKMKDAFKKIVPKNLQNTITKNIDKFKTKSKALFSKVASKITSGIKSVGAKAAGLAKNLGSKAIETLTERMSAFGSKIKTVLNSVKTAVTKTISSTTSSVDEIAKGMKGVPAPKPTGASGSAPKPTGASGSAPKPTGASSAASGAAPKKVGWFSKAKSAVGDVASKAKSAVGDVASKAKGQVVKGATAVKKGGIDVAKKAFKTGVKAFGGAAKVGKMVLKSPFLAPIVEGIFTYKDITKAIAEYKQGEIDKKELDKKIGTRAIKGIGGILGAAAGGTAGAAALGTLSFGLAAPLGAIIGGIGGDMAGRFLGGVIADVIGDKTDTFGKDIVDSKFFKNKMIAEPSDQGSSTPSEGKESLDSALAYGDSAEGLLNPQEASRRVSAAEDPYNSKKPVEIEDGIITKAGKLIKPHKEDFLYAMKDGGPLANAMSGDNKAAEKNNEILEQFKSLTKNLSIKQIELMEMNNKLLKSIQGSLDESPKSGNGTVVTSNNSNTTNVNFKSPGLRDIQLTYG